MKAAVKSEYLKQASLRWISKLPGITAKKFDPVRLPQCEHKGTVTSAGVTALGIAGNGTAMPLKTTSCLKPAYWLHKATKTLLCEDHASLCAAADSSRKEHQKFRGKRDVPLSSPSLVRPTAHWLRSLLCGLPSVVQDTIGSVLPHGRVSNTLAGGRQCAIDMNQLRQAWFQVPVSDGRQLRVKDKTATITLSTPRYQLKHMSPVFGAVATLLEDSEVLNLVHTARDNLYDRPSPFEPDSRVYTHKRFYEDVAGPFPTACARVSCRNEATDGAHIELVMSSPESSLCVDSCLRASACSSATFPFCPSAAAPVDVKCLAWLAPLCKPCNLQDVSLMTYTKAPTPMVLRTGTKIVCLGSATSDYFYSEDFDSSHPGKHYKSTKVCDRRLKLPVTESELASADLSFKSPVALGHLYKPFVTLNPDSGELNTSVLDAFLAFLRLSADGCATVEDKILAVRRRLDDLFEGLTPNEWLEKHGEG